MHLLLLIFYGHLDRRHLSCLNSTGGGLNVLHACLLPLPYFTLSNLYLLQAFLTKVLLQLCQKLKGFQICREIWPILYLQAIKFFIHLQTFCMESTKPSSTETFYAWWNTSMFTHLSSSILSPLVRGFFKQC